MKPVPSRMILPALLPLLLTGCLEVAQHPAWRAGKYDGKPDDLPQQAYFSSDRLAWNAVLADRTHLQNEYERMAP